MASELRLRVMVATAVVVMALSVPAGVLWGTSAAVGVLAAGALSVGNFWWLSRAAVSAASPAARRPEVTGWVAGSSARLLVLLAVSAALCAGGYAHPVAVVVGLSVLPCAILVQGLRSARETS